MKLTKERELRLRKKISGIISVHVDLHKGTEVSLENSLFDLFVSTFQKEINIKAQEIAHGRLRKKQNDQ